MVSNSNNKIIELMEGAYDLPEFYIRLAIPCC
jgi:hypothetical protein